MEQRLSPSTRVILCQTRVIKVCSESTPGWGGCVPKVLLLGRDNPWNKGLVRVSGQSPCPALGSCGQGVLRSHGMGGLGWLPPVLGRCSRVRNCCCQWRSVPKLTLGTSSAASGPRGEPWAMFLWIIFISKYEILSKQHLKECHCPGWDGCLGR